MLNFTIADVLAWARTKPADKTYPYASTRGCAICQFLEETGRCLTPAAGGTYWRDASVKFHRIPFPDGLIQPLRAGTFGGLVERLEKLCHETPVTASEWASIDAYLLDIEQVA